MQLNCFKAFVARFEVFIATRCQKLGFPFWSYVVEVSTKSEDKGPSHIHAYWHTDEPQKDRRHFLGTNEAWRFEGSRPLIRPNSAKGRMSQKCIDRGHFYCQCEKVGRVYGKTNYYKHEAFVVEQKWVIGLWQKRKLTPTNAKAKVIGAGGHTASYLKEINLIEELEERIAIEREKACIDAQWKGAFKPFRFVPEVSLWALQYDKGSVYDIWGKDSRFKFLVLTGPSCMGKTQFAKSLFGNKSTLVVPCQKCRTRC